MLGHPFRLERTIVRMKYYISSRWFIKPSEGNHVQQSTRQKQSERSVGKRIGHFFGATLQIDGFIDKSRIQQINDWIQVFRNTKPAPGTNGPLIPGDPEREAEAIRNKEGIPLLKPVVVDLLVYRRRRACRLRQGNILKTGPASEPSTQRPGREEKHVR